MKRYIIALVSFMWFVQPTSATEFASSNNYDLKLVSYLMKKGIIRNGPADQGYKLDQRSNLYSEIQQDINSELSARSLNCTGGGDL